MTIFILLNKVARFFIGSNNSNFKLNKTEQDIKQLFKKKPATIISLFTVVEMRIADGVKKEDAVKAFVDSCPEAFLDGFNGNALRILSTTMSGSEITSALRKTGLFDYEYWLNNFPEEPRYIVWLFKPLAVGEGEVVRYEKCLGLKTNDGNIRLFNPRGMLLAEVPIEVIENQGKILPYPPPPTH